MNTQENQPQSKLEKNSILESEIEFPSENAERRNLAQTYDLNKLPESTSKRKASALEVYNMVPEQNMKIVDDQKQSDLGMRHSLFNSAKEAAM